MSTLADRREHRCPSTWISPARQTASRWDFAATMIFAAIGFLVAAFALIEGIPLVGEGIWSG